MITWRELADFEKDVRELEVDYFVEEESEAQARERMSPDEQAADEAYRQQRRQQLPGPKRTAWGTWRKRAGAVGRKGRERR